MKTSLLLVAHGSRRSTSNDEVRQLAALMAEQAGSHYHSIHCAFLELAEPSIPEGIEQCIRDGAGEVIVLPYFLSAGRHVAEDIPAEVQGKQSEHPEVTVRIAPYLGKSADVPRILLGLAR